MLIDLINEGAKFRPCPLNTRQSEAVTVSLFFPPAVPPTTPTHGHFVLSPVSLALRDPHLRLRLHEKIGDYEQSTSKREKAMILRRGKRTFRDKSDLKFRVKSPCVSSDVAMKDHDNIFPCKENKLGSLPAEKKP